ncbi:MAG: TonB-dependent receptor [Kordiimonadaceae bacterium]|nr:TonB-dependent receptor [Kordiimonadaceae bacterium]
MGHGKKNSHKLTMHLMSATALITSALGLSGGAVGAEEATEITLEEIVVTAQKRAASLQEVPLSVSAVTDADMDNKQIVNLVDIRNLVPNLYMEPALSAVTTPKMYLRGLGVVNSVFSFESPIGLYFDGVYIARVTGALVDLFDVERVEFLRGPQGTLFGRNSSVGALRIISKKPSLDETSVFAELGYGTKNQIDARLAVSAPLVKDKLGLRVSFSSRTNDGFQTNLTNGTKHMDNNINAARATLLYKASDTVDITLRGDMMFDHSLPTAPSNFLVNDDDDIFTFENTLEVTRKNIVEPWGVSATIDASYDSFDLKSITAYRELRFRNVNDVDGRADVRSFEVEKQILNEWQFSQETFITADNLGDTDLKLTAGVFYLHEKNDFTWALRIFAPPTTQYFDQDTDTLALYAQATYPVTDKLSLTGGLRYTYEKKQMTATQDFSDGTPNTDFVFDDSITAKKVNWQAAADYKVSDDVMLYVTAGTAFRSGGFNGSARDVASILGGSFGPETLITIEGGAKTEWFDNRLRLNVDYYYTDYSDLQMAITLNDGTITTGNVSATTKGIEAELTAVPFKGLEITGNLGTIDQNIENSSLLLPNSADFKGRLGMVYSVPVGGDSGTIRIGADISHTSSFFNGSSSDTAGKVDPYEMVNAQIAYITENERWQFKLSGTNLTDHVFAAHTFNIAGGFIASTEFPSLPRRVMFTVTFRN